MTIPIQISKKKIISNHNEVSDKREVKDHTKRDDFTFQIRGDKARKDSEDRNREREDGRKYTRSEEVNLDKLKKNNFIDDGVVAQDSDELKEKLYPKNLVPRRESFSYIDINCDVCGKEYSVHPVHIRGKGTDRRYTCDKCITNRKA